MKRIIECLIAVMIVVVILSFFLPGSHDLRSDIRAKREAVAAEVKSLEEHEWAGKYYAGSPRGRYLELDVAPQAGFAFTWQTCTGTQSQNLGTVTQAGNRLTLHAELNAEKKRFSLPVTEFILVPWDRRLYLVPPDAMELFAQRIREGYEPRTEPRLMSRDIYLRDGDWDKPVEGLPNVPAEYRGLFEEIPEE